MHHSCNLEYRVHGGMERIPLKLRERVAELVWWPLVVARGHGWKYGPLWSIAKIGSYGFYGHFGVQGIDGQNWLRWAQLWLGTHLALGARWLPPLAPFGLIGLGQKGPNWPTDQGPWTMNYGPRPVEAVGGLNGPKSPFRPKPP
ncbi:hypothetical protein O181_131020 [Austropuccinia psidii MF-1]|uniref:Uncharacterized protein n=1 Tax=Austropuccinia psidii MF-1 TaxID=1389203 RepID=A0A9Q3QBI6_9BASI|nr:hypothetical protein [Austropuccinia psidii MF-1]